MSEVARSLGLDPRSVRARRDAAAAAGHGAAAFTTADELVLGATVGAARGRGAVELLAHELVHVLQFQEARARGVHPRGRSRATDPAERQATRMAAAIADGMPLGDARIVPASAAVHAQDLSPPEPMTAYLPDEAELAATLGALTRPDRTARVASVVATVTTTWTRAQAAGLLPPLGRLRAREREMATSAVQPAAGLPANRPGAYREYLMLDAGLRTGNRIGRDLVTGARSPASVATTGATAANAIVQLRRLDDTLRRALVSRTVATSTGAPLAEVLAMYRVEGDMAMPPSQASLAAGIPSGRTDARTSLNPRPDVSHLVMAFDATRVVGWSDPAIAEFGLIAWFVQIGGLDQVGGLALPRESTFAAWSNDNWRRAGKTTDTQALARQRWRDALATIAVTRQASVGGTSTAVLAQVRDPETLVASILTEATMLHQRLRSVEDLVGPLPAGHARAGARMSSPMAYLRYHAGEENMKAIVLSALVRASGQVGTPLRTAIHADAALRAVVTPLRATIGGMSGPEVETAANAAWATIRAWMVAPGNLEALSTFIETAGQAQWSGWTEHRGNLSRYRVLTEYYRGL